MSASVADLAEANERRCDQGSRHARRFIYTAVMTEPADTFDSAFTKAVDLGNRIADKDKDAYIRHAVFTALAPDLGVAWTIAGLLTVVFILNLQLKSKLALFFGNISYSLYLLHAPVGEMAHSVFARLLGIDQLAFRGPVAFLVALAAAIVAASLLYRFVELPARNWSKAFRYSDPGLESSPTRIEESVA